MPASGDIADPAMPMICMCFPLLIASLMESPPPPASPANLFPPYEIAHARRAESSASAARCVPPARQTQSESPTASGFACRHPALSGFPPWEARNPENLPAQLLAHRQTCQLVADASARGPLA